MLDIFRREHRGGVVWMGTANGEESAIVIVRKLHTLSPGRYFTFDHSTPTRHTIKPEELEEANSGE